MNDQARSIKAYSTRPLINRLPFLAPILSLLILLLLAGCGASIDLPSIADLTEQDTPTEPTPFVTMTPLPVIRTVEPTDQINSTENNQPAEVITESNVENSAEILATNAYPAPEDSAETSPPITQTIPTTQPAPTAEPTPLPEPLTINLRTPLENSQFIAGTGIDVSGTANGVIPGQLIRVALTNETGGQIADASLIGRNGEWRIILPVPEGVSGVLNVEAKIVTPDGTTRALASTPVELIADITVADIPEDDYFITIDRLSPTIIAGQSIYLNGRSGSPLAAYDVTIEIYYDECAISAGPVTFQMYGSGAWNGYLIVPGYSAGSTLCVRAHTGTPGTDSFRQAEKQVLVLDQTDPSARNVQLATPRPGAFYTTPFDITGIAFNPPTGFVQVQVIGLDGAVLWEDQAAPDGFGNWTANVDLVITSPMSVNILAILDNGDGTNMTDRHAVTIQPVE